jgi:uncharacterized cupredoxin-like copper-binding protein
MKLLYQNLKLLLAAFVVVVIIGGCASHPDEEQIQMLEETKAAALSAEQTLTQKKQDASDLAAKCEAKKAELAKVKSEKDMVMKKLEEKQAEN